MTVPRVLEQIRHAALEIPRGGHDVLEPVDGLRARALRARGRRRRRLGTPAHRLSRRRGPRPRGHGESEPARADPPDRANHDARFAWRAPCRARADSCISFPASGSPERAMRCPPTSPSTSPACGRRAPCPWPWGSGSARPPRPAPRRGSLTASWSAVRSLMRWRGRARRRRAPGPPARRRDPGGTA